MTRRPLPAVAILAAALLTPNLTTADEGMWMLHQIAQLDQQELRELGLELGSKEIWDPSTGTGLAAAIPWLGGCTASFVSADGLIATNHHCAFRAIQLNSTPEHDYITDGFLAANRSLELPAPGSTVQVFQGFDDITARMNGALTPDMPAAERTRALERREKEILAECESSPGVSCKVATMFGGLEHYLFRFLKITDVRLVYAPPRSVGEFGGDIDNWMWPRHTGDYTFLRAYVGREGIPAEHSAANVPYRPARWLTLASTPLSENDFVMILGYPGRTFRHRFAAAVEEDAEVNFPVRAAFLREWIGLLDQRAASSKDVEIKVSSTVKGLNNTLKKTEGLIEGFARYRLAATKRTAERELAAWIAADGTRRGKYGSIFETVDRLYSDRRPGRERDLILESFPRAGALLPAALVIERWASQRPLPDVERALGYQDRDVTMLRQRLQLAQRSYDPESDRAVQRLFISRATALPAGARITAVDAALAATGASGDAAIEALLDRLSRTALADPAKRVAFFDRDRAELVATKDPLLDFAMALRADLEALDQRDEALEGELLTITPRFVQALAARSGRPVYPDANSTLRFTYATVKGYSPRDALVYLPFTTLSGVVAKCSDTEPFTCPERLVERAAGEQHARYLNPTLGDVPSCFLSTNDITGGNSGSPIMNGRGELVGLAFDGNYEALTGDYLFDPEIQRTINVDIQYVLWVMDHVDRAHHLMREMGVEPVSAPR
jgi:hypothetical protein